MERRNSERLLDQSMLLVSGKNRFGVPFSETTQVNDASRNGISFRLSNSVETGEVLDLTIGSPESDGDVFIPRFQVKARVLRVEESRINQGSCLAAVSFEGEFHDLGNEADATVNLGQLRQAIKLAEKKVHRGRFPRLHLCETAFLSS